MDTERIKRQLKEVIYEELENMFKYIDIREYVDMDSLRESINDKFSDYITDIVNDQIDEAVEEVLLDII